MLFMNQLFALENR